MNEALDGSGSDIIVLDEARAVPEELRLALLKAGYQISEARFTKLEECSLTGSGLSAVLWGLPRADDSAERRIQNLRRHGIHLPVVAICKSASAEGQRALIRAGVDDCVPSDTAAEDVVVKLEALVRRTRWIHELSAFGGLLRLNRVTRRVYRGDGRDAPCVQLAPQQFRLLEVLAEGEGQTVPYGTIDAHVWEHDMTTSESMRSRAKARLIELLLPIWPELRISTDRGEGYRLVLIDAVGQQFGDQVYGQ